MLLPLLMTTLAFAKPPVTELEAAYECNQQILTDWTLRQTWSNGYSVWQTQEQSKVAGIEAESYALVDPTNSTEQFTFVYVAKTEKQYNKLLKKLFNSTDRIYGEADKLAANYVVWDTLSDNYVQIVSTGEGEIALTYVCVGA